MDSASVSTVTPADHASPYLDLSKLKVTEGDLVEAVTHGRQNPGLRIDSVEFPIGSE